MPADALTCLIGCRSMLMRRPACGFYRFKLSFVLLASVSSLLRRGELDAQLLFKRCCGAGDRSKGYARFGAVKRAMQSRATCVHA